MGKGSGRRPQNISDAELEKAWNSIFSGHPNDDQFEKLKKKEEAIESALNDCGGRTEDDYGNELPSGVATKAKPPKPHNPKDPDRFIDETGDA